MNRLPRRPSRIQPPLRGKRAATPPLGQLQHCSRAVVRPRPPISGHLPHQKGKCDDLDPSFWNFYQQWRGMFKVLDRPWKWLLVIILLVILSMGAGSLL